MKRLCLRLLMVILCLYLAGSVYPLFATVGGHGTTSSPPPAPPPSAPSTPPPSSPAQLGGGVGAPAGPPAVSHRGGGCGGGSYWSGPSQIDILNGQRNDLINELRRLYYNRYKYIESLDKAGDDWSKQGEVRRRNNEIAKKEADLRDVERKLRELGQDVTPWTVPQQYIQGF